MTATIIDPLLIEQALAAQLLVNQAAQLEAKGREQRRAAVNNMRQAGMTLDQIGQILGVSRARVAKIIDGNAPPRRKFYTPEELAALYELEALGEDISIYTPPLLRSATKPKRHNQVQTE